MTYLISVFSVYTKLETLSLIITTNHTLSELNNAADIAHKRIYDRILERCIPVRINNRNIRQDNASANLKEAKKILLSNPDLNQN